LVKLFFWGGEGIHFGGQLSPSCPSVATPLIKLIIQLRGCPSTKDVRSRGGGSLDADVSTFWCKKHSIFRNLWCVRTDMGEKGVEAVRTRRAQFFAILCERPFYIDVLLYEHPPKSSILSCKSKPAILTIN